MWTPKNMLNAILMTLLSVIFWYYVFHLPNENKTLKEAEFIRKTISQQVNKSRLFTAVEVNNRLKAEYEINDDFSDDCDSNCTTKL